MKLRKKDRELKKMVEKFRVLRIQIKGLQINDTPQDSSSTMYKRRIKVSVCSEVKSWMLSYKCWYLRKLAYHYHLVRPHPKSKGTKSSTKSGKRVHPQTVSGEDLEAP